VNHTPRKFVAVALVALPMTGVFSVSAVAPEHRSLEGTVCCASAWPVQHATRHAQSAQDRRPKLFLVFMKGRPFENCPLTRKSLQPRPQKFWGMKAREAPGRRLVWPDEAAKAEQVWPHTASLPIFPDLSTFFMARVRSVG